MCLVALAVEPSVSLRFLLAANRDELHARPAAPLARWSGESFEIVGGRDLVAGGTWLATQSSGRFGCVTNVRSPLVRKTALNPATPTRSRGRLVPDFLGSTLTAEQFAHDLPSRDDYPAFNLIIGDTLGAFYTNETGNVTPLPKGLYGLSNDRLFIFDTGHSPKPWPKVHALGERMSSALQSTSTEEDLFSRVFDALGDRQLAPDNLLPETGVPRALERILSAAFIVTPEYGTRCSTVLAVRSAQTIHIEERAFDRAGSETLRRTA